MIINFVMSSHVNSIIFNHFIKYFKKYSKFKIIQTLKVVDNANIYYYFRPHLEGKLKKNSIVTVHHDLNDNDENLKIQVFIERYKEAGIVVCLNSKQVEILNKHGIKNTIIIPHGYNSDILKMSKKVARTKLTVGFFSSYYPRLVKGEDYLIKLFENISPNNFDFILVGKNRKKLAVDLKKYGFKCSVYENLPYFMFNVLYQNIDCLIITSKYEGGPASFPEALATGTPVIATKVGMVNDFIDKKGICLLSGTIEKDILKIKAVKENIESMSDYINTSIKESIKTWENVINLYDEQFFKLYNDNHVNYKDYLRYTLSYKLSTLYFKKNSKLFINSLLNAIKLLLSIRRISNKG